MGLLMSRTSKIKLRVNKHSKCLVNQQKINYFEYSSKFIEKKG